MSPTRDLVPVRPLSMEIELRRPGTTPVSVASALSERIARFAATLDTSLAELQQAARHAASAGDRVASVSIHSKLADLSIRMLTSPAAAALKPEAAQVDLSDFTAGTRAKLLEAFALAEDELQAQRQEAGRS